MPAEALFAIDFGASNSVAVPGGSTSDTTVPQRDQAERFTVAAQGDRAALGSVISNRRSSPTSAAS